ncbi:unnamed protein product, partial [Brachionus calyciflorus]
MAIEEWEDYPDNFYGDGGSASKPVAPRNGKDHPVRRSICGPENFTSCWVPVNPQPEPAPAPPNRSNQAHQQSAPEQPIAAAPVPIVLRPNVTINLNADRILRGIIGVKFIKFLLEMDLDKSIELKTISSDFDDSTDVICIDDQDELRLNPKVKRTFFSVKSKMEPTDLGNKCWSMKNKEIIMDLNELRIHDPRCDARLYYNRIDDDQFEISLYITCLLDILHDEICEKSYLYT